ncbi:MAG: phosphoadenylyl-sulfate reductase [Chitinophagales bacterium]
MIPVNVDELNREFALLSPIQRVKKLYAYFEEKDVLFTSSFGANSVGLLHLLSRIRPEQTVHFIDTSYHFEETIAYKNQIVKEFGLKVVDIVPDKVDNEYTQDVRLWETDTNKCCNINKVEPLEKVKAQHKVWLSGLMAHQTEYRADLPIFQWKDGLLKCHPLIDVSEEQFHRYVNFFRLPQHPLKAEGYDSIGCSHCTSKGCGREGRWQGQEKSECGLHPDYFKKLLEKQGQRMAS